VLLAGVQDADLSALDQRATASAAASDSNRNDRRTSEMKRAIVMFTAIPLVSLLAACGASTTTATPTPTNSQTTSAAATSTPATSVPAATPTATAAAGPLSGTWSGQYSGVYQGTFTLTWQQSGSNLTGTIILSSPAKTLGITGNAAGSAINFGAVGGVTYSGTVSGGSMSGTYQVPTGGNGSWNATKTS
jgi:hypothetical protein